MECIKALWGDIDFSPHLVVEPERHYADANQTIRVYSDMNTGKWWWCTQVSCTYSRTRMSFFKSWH
jgi:hypothetical protein